MWWPRSVRRLPSPCCLGTAGILSYLPIFFCLTNPLLAAHHLSVSARQLHGSLSLYLCMRRMYCSIVSCPDLYAFRTVILAILLVCGTVPHLFLFRILHLQVSASEHPVPLISARDSQRFSGARGSVNQVCSLYRSTCSTSSIYSARVRLRRSLPL